MTSECDLVWTMVGQAAQAARDCQLLDLVPKFENEISIQMQWVKNELKQIAPQVLVATR